MVDPSVASQEVDAKTIAAALASLPAKTSVIGPLQLTTQVDPARGQALISAALNGTLVKRQLLSLATPRFDLDVIAGASAAKGVANLSLSAEPQYSSIDVEVTAALAGVTTPFKGQLDSWVATSPPVVSDFDLFISGDLTAHTTVLGMAGDIVRFSFINGEVLLEQAVATRFAPNQRFPNDVIAGLLTIQAGATLTLTVPSEEQSGQLFLQATFSAQNTPPTHVSTSVASWPAP